MHAWLTREAKLESYIMQKIPFGDFSFYILFHWSQVRILLFTFIFKNCGALKLVRNSALKIVWTHLWDYNECSDSSFEQQRSAAG